MIAGRVHELCSVLHLCGCWAVKQPNICEHHASSTCDISPMYRFTIPLQWNTTTLQLHTHTFVSEPPTFRFTPSIAHWLQVEHLDTTSHRQIQFCASGNRKAENNGLKNHYFHFVDRLTIQPTFVPYKAALSKSMSQRPSRVECICSNRIYHVHVFVERARAPFVSQCLAFTKSATSTNSFFAI